MRPPLLALLLLLAFSCSWSSGLAEEGGSQAWPTEGGSNSRAGATPLPLPVQSAAPMRVSWRLPLLLSRAGSCVPSPVASDAGWVFLLCEEVVEARGGRGSRAAAPPMLQPTVYAFNATDDGPSPRPLWRTALDALPAAAIDPAGALLPPAQGSLALSSDQMWLLVATRGSVYALSAVLGTRAWSYAFFLGELQPAFPLGSGLALSTLTQAAPQPRVYLSLNLGVACVQGGALAWQYRAMERADAKQPVATSSPTLYEEGDIVLYTQLHLINASLSVVALDAMWGMPKWQLSFSIARRYLTAASLPPLHAPYPVVVGKRAYVSVRGRGLVVLDALSGDILTDGLSPVAGRLVQMGLPPTWAPAAMGQQLAPDEAGAQDRILSVCMKPMYDAEAETMAEPSRKWKPNFQLCASDLSGHALKMSSCPAIGCTVHRMEEEAVEEQEAASGQRPGDHFQSGPPVGQVLYGANGVTLVSALALSVPSPASDSSPSPQPVHVQSCLNALPDSRGLKRWEMPLPPKQRLVAPVLLLSSSRAVALTHDGTTLSLYGLKTVSHKDTNDNSDAEGESQQQLPTAHTSLWDQLRSSLSRLRDRLQQEAQEQRLGGDLVDRIRDRLSQLRQEEEDRLKQREKKATEGAQVASE